MFAFQDKRGAVELAFTDRFGGVSTGPFAELNLALPQGPGTVPGGDQPDAVRENWDIAVHAMRRGAPPEPGRPFDLPPDAAQLRGAVSMHQVHGADVAVVGSGQPAGAPTADALVTAEPGWLLASRAADCVPVLLADPDQGVVGAVHAGRKGVAAGVVTRALDAMRDLGARRVVAWVGPHACGRCYEVPGEMRDEVAALVPEARSETSWGTPALDLGAGVAAQLRRAGRDGARGVPVTELVEIGRCTIEDQELYSFRRDGRGAGRHAGLIWARP